MVERCRRCAASAPPWPSLAAMVGSGRRSFSPLSGPDLRMPCMLPVRPYTPSGPLREPAPPRTKEERSDDVGDLIYIGLTLGRGRSTGRSPAQQFQHSLDPKRRSLPDPSKSPISEPSQSHRDQHRSAKRLRKSPARALSTSKKCLTPTSRAPSRAKQSFASLRCSAGRGKPRCSGLGGGASEPTRCTSGHAAHSDQNPPP